MIRGVLFDMDGVLVDSETVYLQSSYFDVRRDWDLMSHLMISNLLSEWVKTGT